MKRRLIKGADKKVFGVAAGLADYFDIDPTFVRVAFIAMCAGFLLPGLVAYFALAWMMPSRDKSLAEQPALFAE